MLRHRALVQVPTFEEYIDLALAADRPVGIYPETKHPSWHDSLDILDGTSISDLVLDVLLAKGYGAAIDSPEWQKRPVFIQSFEVCQWQS